MTTKDERYRRVALLERAISERGWSLQLERAMAAEFGVTTRTIRSYREDIVKCYRKELDKREQGSIRAEFLVRLRGHQRAALTSGRHGPLSSMLNLEMRVLGIDRSDAASGPSSVEVILRVPDHDDDDDAPDS